MSRINMTRVVIGGLLAGLIVNASEYVLNMRVIGDEMNAQMAKMNLPPLGGNAIAAYVTLGFVIGIVAVWLYAAIRPRFGAGPKTAAIAGVAVWFLAYAYGTISLEVMGVVPARMAAIGMIWGLVELLVATVAGAYVYQEPASAGRAASI